MLSSAELFAARSRERTIPQRSHGQKDFLQDNSKVQKENLRICRTEQWELLREERVERLGNLARGVWKPEEDLVELTLPAGKFWQTMGFNEGGRQFLLPEEAAYLLECGTSHLYYSDLPLSVQEAYEKLLSGGSITLLHYQVYSHLKRLGYIVTRFNPRLKSKPEATTNDKEENDSSCFPALRYDSTTIEKDAKNKYATENLHRKSPHAGKESCSLAAVVEFPSRISQMADHIDSGGMICSGNSRWDFSKIYFPNCAPDQPCVDLPDPEPTLLPENVLGHPANISHWLQKLDLRSESFSRKEQEQWDWERKYKISINADPKVKKCTNWKEYKELLQEKACQKDKERPLHLWKSTIQPLLRPGFIRSTDSVLEKMTVMSRSTLLDDAKRIKQMQNKPKIHFNLYQADGTSEFKKSKPGKPYARLCVCRFEEQIPSLLTLKTLAYHSGDVSIVFALVDYEEVSFYTFKDFQMPMDVYP